VTVWAIVGVEPHVCPEHLTQLCQGLLDCASSQDFRIFSRKIPSSEGCSKGAKDSGAHEWLESLEVRVVFIFNSDEVGLPSMPNPRFFVFGGALDSMCSLFLSKSQVVQETIDGGRGSIVKVYGTCDGKFVSIKEMRALSVSSCFRLNASDTLLNSPLKCWLYRQQL